MISPDLAETVKRLIQTLRAESKPRWISKGIYTGPKAQSGINCEDGNAAADTLETILDALEGLERDELPYLRSQNAVLRDTCDIQRNRIASLESSLAEARKGARTDGTHEVCSKCLYGAYYCFSTEMPPVEIWGTCSDEDCPIKRAQHPTAPQETAEKEGE